MSSPPPPERPLDIVHVIAGLQASGAEIALLRLISGSSDQGLQHTVVSLTGRGDLSEDIEALGCKVISLQLGGGLKSAVCLLKAIPELRALKADVVQGWMVHGNLFAWAARLLLHRRAKLAWNLRMSLKNAIHESPRTLALTRLAALLSRSVDLLVSNSTAGLKDHLALGYSPRRCAVAPNGYDPSVFGPDERIRETMRAAWEASDDAVVFGLIGRYHAVKGHDVLIRAAALLRDRPEMVFVLAGRDASPDNPELVAELARNGVADSFRLLGARNDIPNVLRGLDVMCIPSVYEGFPNALGEGMATGLPCIATDVSDVGLIMGKSGTLIPVGDERALADAMVELSDAGPGGREALGVEARQRFLDHYTLDRVAADYAEQYRALVQSRRSLA